ncbi:Uncharacterised protein [Staphylococcus intermedius NCTC 11048]|uniref:Uncharacterized protein n=1 Tax=Staphylococcus intermedius NCTC 11048 TaxID=1141106 RepID=A0A380GAK1_STAIN|nr:Uncharacterised protein [Staphylococcus intermedius NCTC 11048]
MLALKSADVAFFAFLWRTLNPKIAEQSPRVPRG